MNKGQERYLELSQILDKTEKQVIDLANDILKDIRELVQDQNSYKDGTDTKVIDTAYDAVNSLYALEAKDTHSIIECGHIASKYFGEYYLQDRNEVSKAFNKKHSLNQLLNTLKGLFSLIQGIDNSIFKIQQDVDGLPERKTIFETARHGDGLDHVDFNENNAPGLVDISILDIQPEPIKTGLE